MEKVNRIGQAFSNPPVGNSMFFPD